MIYLLAILFYLLLLTVIGLFKSRRVKTQADFSIAGRTLSPWILVCTMLAVWIGTGSIVGNAGKAYEVGLAMVLVPLGSVFGMMCLTRIAGRARNYEVYSVPEIIGVRYGQTARLLAVIALVMAYMVIVSYQFNAGGMVLEVILTDDAGHSILSAQTATIIAAAFIITYTILAGLMSIAYADIVTGIIITVSLLIALPVLWLKAGGWHGIETSFSAMDQRNHLQIWGVFSTTELINFCLPTFLLILGDANLYQRFFASRNAKGAKIAATIMIVAILVIESLIIVEAWICSSMIPDAIHGKYVLIYAAKHFMPLALGTLFLVTVVGIIISTADSFLLVPSTCVIRDVYLNYINPNASEKKIVFFSRLLVLVFGLIAYLVSLAFAESVTVFEKSLYAFTIYGAAITPCLVAAFFWKRATPQGAIASILCGTVVTLIWSEADFVRQSLPTAVSELDAVLPAITVSVLALFVGSLLTQNTHTSSTIQGVVVIDK
ncbi:MAG: sodium:solute symporter family protein [Candidatus Omnitrophota bacterium]|jgi:SSS family transporter|nr:MAG: sodium:solute symporter family protein [Candidatus Omnitrophota bacterium]